MSARAPSLPSMERFVDQDLTEAEFRECVLDRARLIGVVMQDAEIDGLVTNLVVNGVEVTAYVEAELDRRHPVRVLIRSDDPADLRAAGRQLRADWAATDRADRATPGTEHRSVNDEWSAVQTMRHLVFVHDSWFRRCCLGLDGPVHADGHRDRRSSPTARRTGWTSRSTRPSTRSWPCVTRQAAELEAWLDQVTA